MCDCCYVLTQLHKLGEKILKNHAYFRGKELHVALLSKTKITPMNQPKNIMNCVPERSHIHFSNEVNYGFHPNVCVVYCLRFQSKL